MSLFKYCAIGVCVLVGSELINRCLKHIYYLIFSRQKETHYQMNINTVTDNSRIFSKVIFFPDYGIVSKQQLKVQVGSNPDICRSSKECDRKVQFCDIYEMEDQKQKKSIKVNNCNDKNNFEVMPTRNSFLIHGNDFNTLTSHHDEGRAEQCGEQQNATIIDSKILKPSGYLESSTSLIHMINVLESAKKSLVICIYVLTCKDLLDAVIRAKYRGVKVKVLLERGMASCSEAAINVLHQHNILFRFSTPALLMHHKFAVIDAPEQHSESSYHMYDDTNKGNIQCKIPFCKTVHQEDTFDGVLMTGSFNYTWSAVISNHENVIITNHPHLVSRFVSEFEKLWDSSEI